MEETIKEKPVNRFFSAIGQALKNKTFHYILKRILTSLLTLILIVAVVTALIRLLPDTKFYDVKEYKTISQKMGRAAADNYMNRTLYLVGRRDLQGNEVSVLHSIFEYIYWLLPIPKSIPTKFSSNYSQVLESRTFLVYLGKSQNIAGWPYVTDLLVSRMGISFMISIICTILTYIFSIPLGIAMAKKPGGPVDKVGNIFIVLNWAIPGLVFYLLMNSIMGRADGIFGWGHFGFCYDSQKWWTLVPPIFCVVFLSIPGLAIWVRRYMVDELSSDYVKFARSKGLSENTIMYKHVFRNAVIPLVRGLPATFIGAIIGSYYIEYIWTIPGTGVLLIQGLQGATPDVQLVQGLTVIYAALSMLSFLLGDIVTVFFDPRIKLESD